MLEVWMLVLNLSGQPEVQQGRYFSEEIKCSAAASGHADQAASYPRHLRREQGYRWFWCQKVVFDDPIPLGMIQ